MCLGQAAHHHGCTLSFRALRRRLCTRTPFASPTSYERCVDQRRHRASASRDVSVGSEGAAQALVDVVDVLLAAQPEVRQGRDQEEVRGEEPVPARHPGHATRGGGGRDEAQEREHELWTTCESDARAPGSDRAAKHTADKGESRCPTQPAFRGQSQSRCSGWMLDVRREAKGAFSK